MSTMQPSPDPASAAPTPPSSKLRIASTLAWLAGILASLVAVAIGIPALVGDQPSAFPFVANLVVGIALCAGGYFLRQKRRLGLMLVAAAWAVVGLSSVLLHTSGSAGFGVVLVVLVLALLARGELS